MPDILPNALLFIITSAIMARFFRKDGKWKASNGLHLLRFFTTLSNIFCAASALLICLFPDSRPVWLLKYTGTASVTVTMLTVFLILAPAIGKGGLKKVLAGADLFLHLLNPLIALLSFCLLEKRGMSFAESMLGMIPVLLYGPWYLYRIKFAPEGKRWNDFYGFNKNGKWPASFLVMAVGTFLICLGLMALQNR